MRRWWGYALLVALVLALAGCGAEKKEEVVVPDREEALATEESATPSETTAAPENTEEETGENPDADGGTAAEGEAIPGISAAFLPELNEEIAGQYRQLLAMAGELGFGEGDIRANQVAEADLKLVQIIAHKAGDELHTVQMRIYGKGEMAQANFDLLAESAAVTGGEVLAEDGWEIAYNVLQMTDADSGEMLRQHMVSVLDENSVISCTRGEKEQALGDLRKLLAAE